MRHWVIGQLRRWGAAVGVATVVAWSATGSLAGTNDHGTEHWAGQWTTSTGGVAWREFNDDDLGIAKKGRDAVELFNKLPCKNGPKFYRGGYTAGGDRGKIMGCGTATRMRGRWLSNVGGQFQNGSFDIRITSHDPLTFKGTFRQDDGVSGPYTGTWSSHFDGDGCCPKADDDESSTPTAAGKRLQQDLRKLGFYNGPVDGRTSTRLTDAVKDFQLKVGLKVDGRCLGRCLVAIKTMLGLDEPAAPSPASPPTITNLQEALRKLGFYAGPLDGRTSAAVRDAVVRFQRDAGIPADGRCTERCQLALTKALVRR